MKIRILQNKELKMTEIQCMEVETPNDIMNLCGIYKMLGEGALPYSTGFLIFSPVHNDTEIIKILKNELGIFDFELLGVE